MDGAERSPAERELLGRASADSCAQTRLSRGLSAVRRCLGLVLREGSDFFSFTGERETMMLQLGCVSGLVVKVAKLKKKMVKLFKIMVFSALCPLAFERDTSGQTETDNCGQGC